MPMVGREGRMVELLRRYWDEFVTYDGGLSLVMLAGVLLIPLLFALFFYPLEVLGIVGVALVVGLVGYEGYVIWRRRHPSHA
jgi:hypothetical protein